jgi:hypothetical protein
VNVVSESQVIRELTKLGYRKINKKIMAKPVGYSILLFDLENNIWINKFSGNDANIHTWSSVKIDLKSTTTEFINSIKTNEANTHYSETESSFEFLTPYEQANFLLTSN